MKTMQRVTWHTLAAAIDAGEYDKAQKLWERAGDADDALHNILGAEILIYFSRLDDANILLSQIDESRLELAAAARYALAQGSLNYWKYEYDQAEGEFQTALQMYKFLLKDTHGTVMALYNIGRLQRRRAQHKEAEQTLTQAAILLESLDDERGTRFLKGLIKFNTAVCLHQRGELIAAEELYQSAIELLEQTERLRNYALALNSLGILLNHLGQYEQAIELFVRARTVFDRLGTFDDLAHTTNNLACSMVRLGRWKEAESLIHEALELRQRVSDLAGTAACWEVMAELYLALGVFEKAQDAAIKAISFADAAQNEYERAFAQITLGCVAIQRKDFWRAERFLTDALAAGKKLKNSRVEVKASLYLTELYFHTSPLKGWQQAEITKALLSEYRERFLEEEFQRIWQKFNTAPIRVTDQNELVISGTAIPNWYAAKEALERFLIKNALEQTGYNLTKAGKLLGVTKVHVHHKRRSYEL
jgi:tetratricopeptide (TPR) repeat protein